MKDGTCCAGETALADVKESAEELVEQAGEALAPGLATAQDTPKADDTTHSD